VLRKGGSALDSIVDNLANYLEEMPPYCDSTTVLHALAALKILFPAIHEKVWAIGKTQKTVDVANPSETRRQGFIALHQILSEIAKNKTAVMFIDDLQWGDADSADFLAELIANPKQLRLLFLGNYRTDEVQSSRLLSRLLPLLGEARGAPSFVNMQLDELEQGAATDLATALLSQSESVSHLQPEHIAREAHGHPLFISELVRHAQSQPFEKRPSGKAASETARLPSLNTAILERSTSLPAHARRLLQVIAVAGRPINTVSAFRAAQIDDSGQTGLQILRAAHLIRTRKTEGMDEVETYHDRIQEVIEKSLDEDARVETHHDLALEYERSAQVEPHILAGHFLGARVADKALGYATQAADKAKSVLAFDAACDAYRMALRALDLLPESPARDTQELALRQTFVAMLQMNKGWGALDVIPDLDRAGELAEKTGDLRHFASWLLPRSFAAWIAADLPTALALTERALPINLRHGNTTALAYTYLQRMMTRFWLGDHLGVERDFESGQTYFGDLMFRQNLIGSVIALFAYASWNAWMLGQADLARNRLVELTNAVDINNAHDVMFAAFHAALILSYLGQPEQAEVVGVSAVALAEQHFPNEVAMTRTSLGLARTFMTPPINSIALLREGIAGMLQVGQRLGTAQHTQVLALAQFQKGAVSEALDTVNYALSDHFHEPVFQPEAFRIRAAIRSRIGDTKLAEDDLEQANEIARKRSAKALELRATMTLTQLLRRMGRSQEGYQRLATVVDSFSEGFDTKDLINANALLAAMRS
jgi:tetratricopeptide (TPR) repeat protein